MPVIYLDVLFILNLWVDFLLLTGVARVRRLSLKRWRLLGGAVLGALGSCLLFLPPLTWWAALIIRVVGTVALCFFTFPFADKRRFLGHVFTFAVMGAAFAGLATLLWYTVAPRGFLMVNGVPYYDAPAALLIVFTTLSYAVMCLYDRFTRRKMPTQSGYTLEIKSDGKALVCSCLYDSGCTLREPFSGKPAALIDKAAARELLPQYTEQAVAVKMRYIPFKTVSGEGALPAFVPERMVLTDRKGVRRDITGSYLAVGEVAGDGEFTALVGADIGDLF